MSDLIKREDAIKAYNEAMDELVKWQMEEWQLGDFSECEFNTTDCKHIVRKLEAIPSAYEESFEWCHDCKEYDQDAHCCHRWSKQIRQTVEEIKAHRPQGKWIFHYRDKWMVKAECPKCHRRFEFSPRAIWKCCPMCETRMKGVSNEADSDKSK